MKTSLMLTVILLAGFGTGALAANSACEQCNKAAAQQLQDCLQKAPGETAKQACRTHAKSAQESCANGVCKVQAK